MSSPFIIIDEIESAISAVETKIDTVDGIVDTINSNVNAIKTATAASTSASASGTLSQKLSWIGNTLIGATNNTGGTTSAGTVMAKLNAILGSSSASNQYYYANDNVIANLSCYTSNLNAVASNYPFYKVTDNWIPKANGIVRCKLNVTVYMTSTKGNTYLNAQAENYVVSHAMVSESGDLYAKYCSMSKGTILFEYSSSSSVFGGVFVDNARVTKAVNAGDNTQGSVYTASGQLNVDIPVQKGCPVYFVVCPYSTAVSNGSATSYAKVTSASICGTLTNL